MAGRPAPDAAERALRGLPRNVYAATISGVIRPALAHFPERVYVPNSNANTVTVIDPHTYQVIDQFATGAIPHHVAPAPDMRVLYVDNEGASRLTVLDPATGRPSGTVDVPYPYNLYFTPDGKKAVVVVERLRRVEFRDSQSWSLLKSVEIPWAGNDHLDFTADGRHLFISTEYTGMLARIDTERMEIDGSVRVGGLPVDVRLSPDGTVMFVANQARNGISVVDVEQLREVAFIPTGKGAHGLQVSRDTRRLYVSNRLEGTISVIDMATREVTATWRTGGSPDMLQVNPQGNEVWVTGRFDSQVYVISAATGEVLHRIGVGPGPHGLCYFPNVGDVSLGHNGVYR